jgi:uncharacterized protein
MKLSGEGKLLRIFLGELDHYKHQSLFDAIVLKAREKGLAGATVFRGIEGFGAKSRVVHTAKILRLSEDLPLLIEIVDTEEKILAFIPILDQLLEEVGCGVMITMEKVEIIKYSAGK